MSLRMVFSDARQWRYLVDTFSTLIDEACFIVSPEGVKLRALDPSRIAMIDFFLPPEAFEEFECTEATRLGVNFDDFKKIMRRGKSKDRLELELGESGRRIKIRFLGRAIRTFSLGLLDLGGEELPLPKVPFTVRAKVLSDTMKEALKDAEIVSDYVRLEGSEDKLSVKASSDRGNVEVDFTPESGSLIELEVKEPSSASYSLDYLSDMMKASAISDILTIEFATNKPLALTFDLPGGGRLTFFLAPRIES